MKIDIEEIASKLSAQVARSFITAAQAGGTEADFRREVSRILEEVAEKAGLHISPRDEFSVASGRVDSVYNKLVLEYKRPGVLRDSKSAKTNQVIVQQVKDYILDVAKREKREAHRLAGVATDGFFFIFVRRVGEGWAVDDPIPITPASTERFLRLLFSLSSGRALVPENLVEDFGPKNITAQRAVRALYRSLHSSKQPLVAKLFEQWRLFFSEATDYKEWAERIESKPEFRAFVASLWTREEIKHLEAAKVFFVLHTYYALLIKLVASLAAARFAGGEKPPLNVWASKSSEELLKSLHRMENEGYPFNQYGIRNFLEGDFFGWYLAAWNEDIEDAARRLIMRLGEYDPGTLELAPENTRDLLKKLYHYLLPREIRHDLGEYYTPDWLAERLIHQTLGSDLGDPHKRVLDPACGSGTFLVILIKHIRQKAKELKMGPTQTLDLIRKNIVGFDLNPLAVIAARTNYLLALGDLLKETKRLAPEGIDIPIYQCDSILTPSAGTELLDHGLYKIKTSVGLFEVPEVFATKERMEALSNLLDECVESGSGEEAFFDRLSKSADIFSSELSRDKATLINLYNRLAELHREGLNGRWARIIKNSFAPLFQEPFNFVVGNPPWINWESLPDKYREDSKKLWIHYGLFPHAGMDTILGKGKKDISMLMTYVSIDKYLVNRGKLGFVLTQSLFKTSGAGQGFRRFLLPDQTPIRPIAVDDMIELNPFEGAANRTSVGVFQKGLAIRYPVVYQYWIKKKKGRGSTIGFDTPYEEVIKNLITYRDFKAHPVDDQDITSPWITARFKTLKAIQKVLGKSEYMAHAGAYSGGANAVYWVEIVGERPGGLKMVSNITEGAKRKVESIHFSIEEDLLYPLLRGKDLKKWNAQPTVFIIVVQDPVTRCGIEEYKMSTEYPNAYKYLKKYEDILRQRAAFRRYFIRKDKTGRMLESGPFYSMFDIGKYSFSNYKVVWQGFGVNRMMVAVCGRYKGKPVMTNQAMHPFISLDNLVEAHYICSIMNSAPFELAVISHTQKGGKSFAQSNILEKIRIPKFDEKKQVHINLSNLSKEAHLMKSKGDEEEVKRIEAEIDKWAAKLWGLTDEELAEIKSSLEEM